MSRVRVKSGQSILRARGFKYQQVIENLPKMRKLIYQLVGKYRRISYRASSIIEIP